MNNNPRPSEPGAPGRSGTTSRRAVLRTGLALSPVLVLGGVAARAALRSIATASSSGSNAGVTAQTVPGCVITPRLTEGPYFVDEQLFRSDIRADPATGQTREGATLRLGFRVFQVGGDAVCSPLAGAMVDVWHCDALGTYSDVNDPGFSTVGLRYLRGSQITDENGSVEFITIYPGWYQGRTVHIHFKVRTDPDSDTGYEFTSQVFFDDALTDEVHAQMPYAAKGRRTLRNDGDNIYQSGGEQLLLQISQEGDGYAAVFDVGVDLSAPSSPTGPGGPGGPGGPPPGGRPPGA